MQKLLLIIMIVLFSVTLSYSAINFGTVNTVRELSVASIVCASIGTASYGVGYGLLSSISLDFSDDPDSGLFLKVFFIGLTLFSGVVLERAISPALSLYANYLVYGFDPPLDISKHSAFWYAMSWVTTLMLVIPSNIFIVVGFTEQHFMIVGMMLLLAGILSTVGLQAGAISMPLMVVKL